MLPGSTPLPPEVDAILERRCRECHTEPLMMFAPMPLLDWEDVQAPRPGADAGVPVYRILGQRIASERFPMPPVTRPQLDDAEREVLADWIDACAPPAVD